MLLKSERRDRRGYVCKLGDFGLSRCGARVEWCGDVQLCGELAWFVARHWKVLHAEASGWLTMVPLSPLVCSGCWQIIRRTWTRAGEGGVCAQGAPGSSRQG